MDNRIVNSQRVGANLASPAVFPLFDFCSKSEDVEGIRVKGHHYTRLKS